MNSSTFLVKFLLIYLTLLFFSTSGWGQTNNSSRDIFEKQQNKLSGFSEDDRVKVLLLNLLPSGMTETAAKEIAKALQLNVYNTNHFTVVGISEWSAQIKEWDPSLADCHDIACGVMIGKMFHADKILVLKEGKIEAIGKHQELLDTSETYRKLYYLQFIDE